MSGIDEPDQGFLATVRVLELADELGEYAGKVLAGLGADVVKVEPPEGESTRRYGPFLADEQDPDRSLCFWHYNFGKRAVTLDLDSGLDRQRFVELAKRADVILETRPRGYLEDRGLGFDDLSTLAPGIIVARISPFGDTGPWKDHHGSDLVHLALGGVMMNCGYDPDPSGFYETAPVAPQMWQAYHIAGEMMAMGIIAALFHRMRTGEGQYLSGAVHEAVAKQTETDLPNWIYSRLAHNRQTCRHSRPNPDAAAISQTKDGRWNLAYTTYLAASATSFGPLVEVLDRHGMADDLTDPRYEDIEYRTQPAVTRHISDVINRFNGKFLFERGIWREFQEAGLTWAPKNRPEENLTEEHWRCRQTFLEVEHPELGRTFSEVGAKWLCPQVPWRTGPRAPLLGEHNDQVLRGWTDDVPRVQVSQNRPDLVLSPHGKPFALSGIRMIDLSWLLASAGAGRFLSALGAEVIKIEHDSKPDMIRWGNAMVAEGGRTARDAATAPLDGPIPKSPNRSGFFMEINSGKRCISLNLKHPRGRELLIDLIVDAHVLAEGFSPGTMDRLGLGYPVLKELNPKLIYVQQSGLGQIGTYGRMRSFGPVAAGFAGLSEMSGFPEPWPPAGIGYSYLDWFGAYNMATAILAGLYRQHVTGEGCWIDSSQVESGTYLTGTAILDHSANGRRWRRYGNRSPYKPAAPHGAYRTAGDDRWIAIACFTEQQWLGLVTALGDPEWARDKRFSSLGDRLGHQDELDRLVETETSRLDGLDLTDRLQAAGVSAGVCQTAQDRYEMDPQLKHLNWLVELQQTEIGKWPVKEFPVSLSRTPAYAGGIVDRHGPSYGEDNDHVYGELLGLGPNEIRDLKSGGVI